MAASLAMGPDPRRIEEQRPLYARQDDYIGASSCKACHPTQYKSWRKTFHSRMTQLPSRETVLGRFDGNEVSLYGKTAVPFERDGRYFFRLPAYAGRGPREAEVALTVGSRRHQQYFERVEGADGTTYRRLPLFWHNEAQAWMHLNGMFLEVDNDDWSAHEAVWNANCIFCHNTGIAPGLRVVAGTRQKRFDSHVSDLGITCEACHGPGRQHAERNASLTERYLAQLGFPTKRDMVNPVDLHQAESSALCGQCHSQRLPDPPERIWEYLDRGPSFRPGGTLKGHVTPVRYETPSLDVNRPDLFKKRFWRDETPRLTAYEYLALTQSPCFRGGEFNCRSCHSMHSGDVKGQLEPEMRTDQACTQCHDDFTQNLSAHTHHAPESTGSRCLECHMPRAVYGIMEIHRSHRIESPDVKRDIEAGRPNACTSCHLDKSALWAADQMRKLWGDGYQRPERRANGGPLDWPDALVSAHAGDPVLRAVYLTELGRPDAAIHPEDRGFALAHALIGMGDAYGSIRYLARRTALRLDQSLGLDLKHELLDFHPHASRTVRDKKLMSLIKEFQAVASKRLEAPPPGLLLNDDYDFERQSMRQLLSLQQNQAISVGE